MSELARLQLRKEALLDEIRALDFDHDTGKIWDEAYQAERAELVAETAVVLKRLDELTLETVPSPVADVAPVETAVTPAAETAVISEIEAAVAAARKGKPPQPQAKTAVNGKARFCSQCGKPLDADDRFCAHCGSPVYAKQPA